MIEWNRASEGASKEAYACSFSVLVLGCRFTTSVSEFHLFKDRTNLLLLTKSLFLLAVIGTSGSLSKRPKRALILQSPFSSPTRILIMAKAAGQEVAPPKVAILRIEGPDSKGIVAACAQLLYGHGCNIIDAEQHTDQAVSRLFQRIVFDFGTMHTDRISLQTGINEVCSRFGMISYLNWGESKKKIW
jgi:predicted amino acid-binding ACT domain protein